MVMCDSQCSTTSRTYHEQPVLQNVAAGAAARQGFGMQHFCYARGCLLDSAGTKQCCCLATGAGPLACSTQPTFLQPTFLQPT